MVYKFFDKKSTSEASRANGEAKVSEQKGGDVHHSPSINFDESDGSRQATSRLYKKNPPTPLGRNNNQESTTNKERVIKKNEQLANKLHTPIFRKFKKRKVDSAYIDEIWAADLADMQLLCKKKIKKLGTYYALSICFLDTHLLFR